MPDEAITEAELAAAARRAEAAEAKLAEIHRTVVDGFLAQYGTSTLPVFTPAVNLARSVRKILAGSGVAAREAVAEAERERLLDLIATRFKVVMAYPDNGYLADAVPWAALLDVLQGAQTAGFGEAGEPEDAAEPVLAWQAATEAERERLLGVLSALKVTLTRPGWGFKQASNFDVVPWEALVKVLGGEEPPAADGGALARVRKLGETWAGLPIGTTVTLREAGRVLLERIDGEGSDAT